MSFAGGRPGWWIRNLRVFINWSSRILGKSELNRAQGQGPSQKEDLEQPESVCICIYFMVGYIPWYSKAWYCWKGALDSVRIPSPHDWHRFFISRSWYANPLKAASSLMLLYVTRSSVSPFGYNVWGFLSFTLSSFWPISGVPPNADEERWQVLGHSLSCWLISLFIPCDSDHFLWQSL